MLYLNAGADFALNYVSCGTLDIENGFLHARRTLDTHVLIVVRTGVLHICTGGRFYDVGPSQMLMLFGGMCHYGTTPSTGRLTYDWAHFTAEDPDSCLVCARPALQKENYFLPEYARLSTQDRINVLFSQLLDISRRSSYAAPASCRYALSLLALQLSAQQNDSSTPDNMPDCICNTVDYIRKNYMRVLSVGLIAAKYDYNPCYFARLFHRCTGQIFADFVTVTRLRAAKELLVATDAPVKQICALCGIPDEKYFMKLFKKHESMTPTQYRRAFRLKNMVD